MIECIPEPHKYALQHQGSQDNRFPDEKDEKSKQLQEIAYAYKLPCPRIRMELEAIEMTSWIFSLEKRT